MITGCSGGIGRSAADQLAQRGHMVWATARRDASVEELDEWSRQFDGRAFARRLDVTDPDTATPVMEEIISRGSRLDALVNNAGFGQIGAFEDVPLAKWRAQFETNLFGVVALSQAVLPHMRARGEGRIINISSVVAHAAVPLMAPYSASKHALEAATTALRIEAAAFGIYVSAIEPGPTATSFRHQAESTATAIDRSQSSAYAGHYRAFEKNWAGSYGRGALKSEDVARVICRAIEASRPRARYRVGAVARLIPALLAVTPDRVVDWFAGRLLKSGNAVTRQSEPRP